MSRLSIPDYRIHYVVFSSIVYSTPKKNTSDPAYFVSSNIEFLLISSCHQQFNLQCRPFIRWTKVQRSVALVLILCCFCVKFEKLLVKYVGFSHFYNICPQASRGVFLGISGKWGFKNYVISCVN